jgi:hypothetical protein
MADEIFERAWGHYNTMRTYELDRFYSEDHNDPDRRILDEKLNGLIGILHHCLPQKPSYVVNGRYLTITIKKKCSRKLDTVIISTLCNEKLGRECKLKIIH